LEDAPASWFHDAIELSQALGIIGDMLQDMVAENDIKAVVLERDMMQVKVHVR